MLAEPTKVPSDQKPWIEDMTGLPNWSSITEACEFADTSHELIDRPSMKNSTKKIRMSGAAMSALTISRKAVEL